MNRIFATYFLETSQLLERTASVIAGEQSSGTFIATPGETPELKERFGARIESLEPLGSTEFPSLPGGKPGLTYQQARMTLSWPLENVGVNLPTLVATLLGNLFELSDHSGLKLLDITLPKEFISRYPGPAFGISGTRQLTGVFERPIIGTIIKPSVGLTPSATAELVQQLCDAGIDFIKDDELMADAPHSPLAERVEKVMAVINSHAQKTGKKVMYAVNVTDELDAMKRHHDTILQHGGTCLMASLHSVGFAGLSALRKFSQVPIHGHRNGWGMLNRHPALGVSYVAWQKLWRLAGADHLHVNGLKNKFFETDESVTSSLRAVLEPLFPEVPMAAMPVIASGQWAGQVPGTVAVAGSGNFMFVAGGGIIAHPGGPGAGVRSVIESWEATRQGISLAEYAKTHTALRQALETFG
jgi:ribulose-bisphosphate carboxylase large chain